MDTVLPDHLQKYFWGDNLSELSWKKHQKYISKTLLEKGDHRAAKWLLEHCDKHQLYNELESYNLNKKSANFWKIYLS